MIYSERTKRSAVYVDFNGNTQSLLRVPFMQGAFSEAWLQDLIAKHPALLQSEEIGAEYSQLVCIGREVKVGTGENTGKIDNLYVSSSGHIVVVETKLFRNQEARRTVVAQIIDYAKDLQQWDCEDLDEVASDYSYQTTGQAYRVFDMMLAAGHLTSADSARFVDAVNRNLEAANFLLLIVGDGIRSGVERLAEFITSHSSLPFKLGLLELEVYQHGSSRVVIPNVLAKTSIIPVHRATSDAPAATKTNAKVPAPVLPTSEFLRIFSANGGYDLETVAAFVSDLCTIPGVSYTVHPTEIRLRASADGVSVPFLIFGKSGSAGRPAADIWLRPLEITAQLVKGGKHPTGADSYMDFYREFIDTNRCKYTPYEVPGAFYYANVLKVLSNSTGFMGAVEQLISEISD